VLAPGMATWVPSAGTTYSPSYEHSSGSTTSKFKDITSGPAFHDQCWYMAALRELSQTATTLSGTPESDAERWKIEAFALCIPEMHAIFLVALAQHTFSHTLFHSIELH